MAKNSFKIASVIHRTLYSIGIGREMMGMKVLILKTKGRKSGKEIETPLSYFTDGDDLFLIASKGGAPSNPGWFYNLTENKDVSANINGSEKNYTAVVVTEETERKRLYDKAVAAYKGYGEYTKKTTRVIPVVKLVARSKA